MKSLLLTLSLLIPVSVATAATPNDQENVVMYMQSVSLKEILTFCQNVDTGYNYLDLHSKWYEKNRSSIQNGLDFLKKHNENNMDFERELLNESKLLTKELQEKSSKEQLEHCEYIVLVLESES